MSLWKRIFGSTGGGRNPADDRWWTPVSGGGGTRAVTPETVVQIPEVYDCLTVLSQSIAQLPFFVYRAGDDGSRTRLGDHPVTQLLGEQANITQETTAFEMRAQMSWDAALYRNAFAEIRTGRGSRATVGVELIRIDPPAVSVKIDPRSGDFSYEVADGAARRTVMPDRMLHLRVTPLQSNNILGRSILADGWQIFARALGISDYSLRFFENDATPGGIIEYEGVTKTPEQADQLREKWQRNFSGRNRGKVAILEGGGKYKPIPIENDKAQFVETDKELQLKIARLWRMPPHKIGLMDKASFASIEQQALEFVIDTLMPWIVMWEQAVKFKLLADPRMYAHHNVAGLLRGDLKSRYESYAQARNWGWLSVNDIRRLENMDPIANGDIYLEPLNMVPSGTDRTALQQRQAPQQNSALTVALENYLARRLLPAPGE